MSSSTGARGLAPLRTLANSPRSQAYIRLKWRMVHIYTQAVYTSILRAWIGCGFSLLGELLLRCHVNRPAVRTRHIEHHDANVRRIFRAGILRHERTVQFKRHARCEAPGRGIRYFNELHDFPVFLEELHFCRVKERR